LSVVNAERNAIVVATVELRNAVMLVLLGAELEDALLPLSSVAYRHDVGTPGQSSNDTFEYFLSGGFAVKVICVQSEHRSISLTKLPSLDVVFVNCIIT